MKPLKIQVVDDARVMAQGRLLDERGVSRRMFFDYNFVPQPWAPVIIRARKEAL
jgi:hypothetical protein